MSLGTIKDYTPNFNLIIPEFNISGWHDYLEENFRSIDALFYNLFGINNYSGIWEKLTSYTAGQVVFIGEDTDYSGRLVKVLIDHTTTNDDFSTFFANNPTYYELFADASTAQYYAQKAKDWAVKMDGPVEGSDYSAKYYADLVDNLSTEITTLYNIANDIQTVANISTDVENVADNGTNITTVATNISSINTTATNITDINTVASISSNVTSVAGISANITTVASNNANITAVAQDLTNINTVASNQTNINTTATNISAINTNASNITAIQNASTNATNAQNSANAAANSAEQAAISAAGTHFKLFQHNWFDYLLNDMAWLRADTFSWQDGTVYSDAYDHLVADVQGKEYISETIAGHTIWYRLADDGHKIVTQANDYDGSTNVNYIYEATGVAWYYILDETNQRFKLPRTKHAFTGYRDDVGKYVEAGLPNITGQVGTSDNAGYLPNGAFYASDSSGHGNGSGGSITVSMNASLSNSIYGNSTTVQPPATQMYLYFYVGQFSQSAIEQTAGLNSELFNGKIDLDGHNATFAHIVETYSNGASWYRIWSDGWVEQGGDVYVNNTSIFVQFLVPMADSNYYCGCKSITSNSFSATASMENPQTTGTTVRSGNDCNWRWIVSGYKA